MIVIKVLNLNTYKKIYWLLIFDSFVWPNCSFDELCIILFNIFEVLKIFYPLKAEKKLKAAMYNPITSECFGNCVTSIEIVNVSVLWITQVSKIILNWIT